MTIDLETHTIKVAHEGIDKYDVYRVKTVQEGDHKGERRESNHAYGIPIHRAIQIVIQDRVDNEYKGTAIELNGFMEAYANISTEVLNKLKAIMLKK